MANKEIAVIERKRETVITSPVTISRQRETVNNIPESVKTITAIHTTSF